MIEGLLHARQVIYSYEIPYVTHVSFGDVEGLITALKDLRHEHSTGGIPLNSAGRNWALKEYDADRRFQYLFDVITSGDPADSDAGFRL